LITKRDSPSIWDLKHSIEDGSRCGDGTAKGWGQEASDIFRSPVWSPKFCCKRVVFGSKNGSAGNRFGMKSVVHPAAL
jgi:hypothetical protein